MKYVCLDEGAIAELVSGREYQSIDFEQGEKLINGLSGNVGLLAKIGKIYLFQDSEGAFLTTPGPWKQKRYLVIDCEQSSLFTQLPTSESLTSFQKLLRFCTKYWSGGIYNNSEKIIGGTTKAIVFPLPFSANMPFRIAIEREPLSERVKKRDMSGKFLLVYKSGRVKADSATEAADLSNFRKVFDRLQKIYASRSKAAEQFEKERDGNQMASTELASVPSALRSFHMPFEDWGAFLTGQQKNFIFANAKTPHRLQGPAGTGKSLSLILRAVHLLRNAERKHEKCHALLVTHSEATREAIQSALYVIDTHGFQDRDRDIDDQSLTVETLASLCARVLSQSISESEFVDRDAQDSKILQELYIEKAISQVRSSDFPSYKPHMSNDFRSQFATVPDNELAPLFQHEISILIKGRAGESFDAYKKCPPLKYGLPVSTDADKGLVFLVYQHYQEQLKTANQFDTDDVVISAVGQLDTPIWRRRRSRDGYDFIGLDETHLFNMNELHVFHYFTRGEGESSISFTVDQAQAVGDRGWNDISSFAKLFDISSDEHEEKTDYTAIFRCSPAIAEFSYSILASGATLFTNFENTLVSSQSVFTPEDERKSQPVKYIDYPDDRSMVEGAFQRAEELQQNTRSNKSQILVTSLSESIIKELREYSEQANKPVTVLERRGDFTQIEKAEKSGHLVLGHADFVGGLEFNVAIVVGVDKGRVPQEGGSEDSNSRSYASYAAHNRLYVVSSRARYALNILGVKSRGPSELIRAASQMGLIEGVPSV